MSIIHIIQNYFDDKRYSTIKHSINSNDVIVFIQDGVYLTKILTEFNCENLFALKDDFEARGLLDLKISKIKLIDYSELINLICKYDRVKQWDL